MTRPTPIPQFPDDMRSEDELGCVVGKRATTFRVFAPRAVSVTLVVFERFDAGTGKETPMTLRGHGVWEANLPGRLHGRWYGYRVDGPRGPGEMFDPSVIVADPYSRAVTTRNTWRMDARTLIADTSFDWGDDSCPLPDDRAAVVIYECHVRDLTSHPSSGATRPGSYSALADPSGRGGLAHIRSLGVNAVEFLPLMKFGTMEIPYRDGSVRSDGGRVNDWNPYERNHWGYMPAFFFAPETYYASGGTAEPGAWNGTDAGAVTELKELIRTLHRKGTAVIMDVVYNHTSQYDLNPFKYIDKHYYYRCGPDGGFLEESGCGNDFHTGRPMTSRLIVDSISCWMREYHVDGFRFDLAAMIDKNTCRLITAKARSINPKAVLIAEPWGGGRQHPPWFDQLGWSSWNDRYRDALRGDDPVRGRGAIFGGGLPDRSVIAGVLSGTLKERGGLFSDPRHGVAYLESHDGYTLGDFIRIATGEFSPDHRFSGTDLPGAPAGRRLALNRLAALVLLTSPGPVMLHQGQEYARSKVIAATPAPDPDVGMFDHNSYNKDNGTNYLDYGFTGGHRALMQYYRQLIALRGRHPALAGTGGSRDVGFPGDDPAFAAVTISAGGVPPSGRFDCYIVLLNFHETGSAGFELPEGSWRVLADASGVSPPGAEPRSSGVVPVPPSSGTILGRVAE